MVSSDLLTDATQYSQCECFMEVLVQERGKVGGEGGGGRGGVGWFQCQIEWWKGLSLGE